MSDSGLENQGQSSVPVSPGMMVYHYRIVDKIGSGGMGDVFGAEDTKLGRRVALKFLSSQIADDSSLRARFTREVQAVAALNHPNIVHVYEVSDYQGRPFFVMEYVEGQSLKEVIRAGTIGFDEVLRIAIGICEGLEAAHNVGIVHRDIKPANIVLDRSNRVKILDFGLAKRATDPDLTIVGSTLGTVSYMSPEQVQGRESDRRSDIFSLGIVLYEMITGRLPFKGAFDAATLTAIVTQEHEPLARHRPDTPPDLQPIMDRLLAKDINSRFQSLSELLPELQNLRDRLRLASDPMLSAHRMPPPKAGGRGKLVGGIAAVAVALIAVTAAFLWRPRERPVDPMTRSQETVSRPALDSRAETPASAVMDSAQLAELEAREERLRLLEDSLTRARQAEDEARIATSAADSIALKRLKDSLQRVQDQLASAERTRLESESRITEPPKPRVDTVYQTRVDPTPTETAPSPAEIARVRREDSTQITSTLASFWRGLESRNMSGMKSAFPDMPSRSEAMWQTFLDNTRDLSVTSNLHRLDLDGKAARASVAVTMAFRDAGGRRTQDVIYDARLRELDGKWIITALDPNR